MRKGIFRGGQVCLQQSNDAETIVALEKRSQIGLRRPPFDADSIVEHCASGQWLIVGAKLCHTRANVFALVVNQGVVRVYRFVVLQDTKSERQILEVALRQTCHAGLQV